MIIIQAILSSVKRAEDDYANDDDSLVWGGFVSAEQRHDRRSQFRVRRLAFAYSSDATTHVYHSQLCWAAHACRQKSERQASRIKAAVVAPLQSSVEE